MKMNLLHQAQVQVLAQVQAPAQALRHHRLLHQATALDLLKTRHHFVNKVRAPSTRKK